MNPNSNPIADVDYSFKTYSTRHAEEKARHMMGNAVPDYAFGMDYELRKRLDSIPGLFTLGKRLLSVQASLFTQRMNQNAVCATPTTFPDIYEIGCECSRRLGIAVPNIYIMGSPEINAMTLAVDDMEPVIMIYSGLYERFTHGELKAVIGHECGHAQNYHSTYQSLGNLLAQSGIAGVQSVLGGKGQWMLTKGAQLALNSWSRAAEVTADRAGMICADNLEDCLSVNAKLMYGAAFGEHQVDYETLKKQLRMQMSNAMKYAELQYDHPTLVRRMMVEEEFAQCRVYYDWRPDLKQPDSIMRSREECDERCKKYISLSEKGIQ